MRLSIAQIHEMATDRPPGYVNDVLSHGSIDGDYLEISPEALADLRAKYRIHQPLPSATSMVSSAMQAAASEVLAIARGSEAVSDADAAARLATCRACEHFRPSDERCSLCGCYLSVKTRLRSQHCPVAKW